jgi:hypothetical protein
VANSDLGSLLSGGSLLNSASGPMASFKATPAMIGKTVASTILSVLGFHFLNQGRKNQDLGMMIKGALMALLSIFLFV